jgi:hypothetical protein
MFLTYRVYTHALYPLMDPPVNMQISGRLLHGYNSFVRHFLRTGRVRVTDPTSLDCQDLHTYAVTSTTMTAELQASMNISLSIFCFVPTTICSSLFRQKALVDGHQVDAKGGISSMSPVGLCRDAVHDPALPPAVWTA